MTATFPRLAEFKTPKFFKNINTHNASIVALILICAMMVISTGCTAAQKQTTLQVVTQINAHIPEVVAAAGTVAAVISSLDPALAIIITPADTTFNALATTLQAVTASYLANPNATTLQAIQTAINSLESTVNTSILNAAGIKDVASQQLALAALKGLLTVITVVFALVAPTESTAMLMQLRDTNTIHLAKVRRFMDEQRLQQEASADGVNLNQAFSLANQYGF